MYKSKIALGRGLAFFLEGRKTKFGHFRWKKYFEENLDIIPKKKSFHSDLRRNCQGPLHQPLFSTCTRRNVCQSLQRCLTRRQSSFSKQVGIQSKGDAVRNGVTPIDSIEPLKLASLSVPSLSYSGEHASKMAFCIFLSLLVFSKKYEQDTALALSNDIGGMLYVRVALVFPSE